MNSNSNTTYRLNKYLADCGICSRREADRLIRAGRVTIGGAVAALGDTVSDGDEIALDNKKVTKRTEEKTVLAFYKPRGVTCSAKDAHAKTLISDVLKYPARLTYAGRLDRESEGLLVMTDDGELIDKMMRPGARHEKEYLVTVDQALSDEVMEKLSAGVYLPDLKIKTRPCQVSRAGKRSMRVVLTQGVNRQLRRMCEAHGLTVKKLKRIRVVNIELAKLQPGEYRKVEGEELASLYRACGLLQAARPVK